MWKWSNHCPRVVSSGWDRFTLCRCIVDIGLPKNMYVPCKVTDASSLCGWIGKEKLLNPNQSNWRSIAQHFKIVNFVSRAVLAKNCLVYDSRVVTYDCNVFTRLVTGVYCNTPYSVNVHWECLNTHDFKDVIRTSHC